MIECVCQESKGYLKLKPGMTVRVYLEQEDGSHKLEGLAVLVEKKSTWHIPEPFPIVEDCKICKKTTNNIKEKWKVRFISNDPFYPTFEAIRYIHRFHSYGTPHIRDEFDTKD